MVKEDSSRVDQLGKQIVGKSQRCSGRLCANELSLTLKTETLILIISFQEKEKGLRHDSRSNDEISLYFEESLSDV